MHFEAKRVPSKGNDLKDNALMSNEIQDDSEADDDVDQNYSDSNNTEVSPKNSCVHI